MTDISKFRQTLISTLKLEPHDHVAETISQQALNAHLDQLRLWQAQRLEHTYADLLADERFAQACRFFLSDVYSAKDFRQRDHEIKHLYASLSRILPDALLRLVKKVIELNDLTNELDTRLWSTLSHDLGVTGTITPELYAEAYRLCNNYAERVTQIELIVQVGQMVDFATKIPLAATTLRLVRTPVTRAGWHELHAWIERGFLAFQHIHGASDFLATIHAREMGILGRIYAGDPQPFK